MTRYQALAATASLVLAVGSLHADSRRDYMIIVGSTTIYPFSEMVVERFLDGSDFKAPMVQPLGSGGGLMLFCNGTDDLDPDIAYSSRPMRESERETCGRNGIEDVVEIKIGYDGIVVAQSSKAPALELTRKDIYLALARFLPNPGDGDPFIDNPHRTWQGVNVALPPRAIEVWVPRKGAGTRDVFSRLVMEEGCRTLDGMMELEEEDPWQYRSVCRGIRDDDAYRQADEDDELTVGRLKNSRDALAVVTFSVLKTYADDIRAVAIDGIAPAFETISNGSYLAARPLFLYVKKANVGVYPGILEFVAEFTSEAAWGPGGYLRRQGLIPMREEERTRYADIARELTSP